jgi:hypothetical protein
VAISIRHPAFGQFPDHVEYVGHELQASRRKASARMIATRCGCPPDSRSG